MDEEMAKWIRTSGRLIGPYRDSETEVMALAEFPKLVGRIAELEAEIEVLKGMGWRIANFDRRAIPHSRGD